MAPQPPMTSRHTNTSTLASELTEYLITPGRYDSESPLLKLVQRKINTLADEVAAEIVAETPELRERVRERTAAVVASLIANEGWLEKATVDAISKALAKHREESDE